MTEVRYFDERESVHAASTQPLRFNLSASDVSAAERQLERNTLGMLGALQAAADELRRIHLHLGNVAVEGIVVFAGGQVTRLDSDRVVVDCATTAITEFEVGAASEFSEPMASPSLGSMCARFRQLAGVDSGRTVVVGLRSGRRLEGVVEAASPTHVELCSGNRMHVIATSGVAFVAADDHAVA